MKSTDSPFTIVFDEWKKKRQNKILRWLHKRAGRQHVLVIFGFKWERTGSLESGIPGLAAHWSLMYFDTVNRVQSFYNPQRNALALEIEAAVVSHGILDGYEWRAFGHMRGMHDHLFEGPCELIMHGFCGLTVIWGFNEHPPFGGRVCRSLD